jgi:hypothetical protein
MKDGRKGGKRKFAALQRELADIAKADLQHQETRSFLP